MVNMKLQHGVHFPNLEVTLGTLWKGTDALIGMDVITQGDFAITNLNGKTVMSFRVPSIAMIDFLTPPPPTFRPGFRSPAQNRGKRR
jgi:hypothetical protein